MNTMSPRCLPVRMRRFSVSLNVFSAKGPQQEERVSAASTVCAPRRELDEGERLSEVAAEHDRLHLPPKGSLASCGSTAFH